MASLLDWAPASVLFLAHLWGQGLALGLLGNHSSINHNQLPPADLGAAAAFAAARQQGQHISGASTWGEN